MSIIYLDTSALLKVYIQEAQSENVRLLFDHADGMGTSIVTYTEMASAMARAARMQLITEGESKASWGKFLGDWPGFLRLNLSSQLTERAALLAWDFGLRGYDAIHLATALTWQEALGSPICLATFDRLLWGAGKNIGVEVWPET